MLSLIEGAAGNQSVTVGGDATTEATLLYHLPKGSLGTDGDFLAFTISLPEADVVHQSVGMGIDFLFALIDTPYLDAMLDEPLDDEGSFLCSSADSVEHKYQQDIELTLFGIFLEKLNLVTITGTDLEARDASFLFLDYDCPSHSVTEVVAGFPLNGDICLVLLIVVDLLRGRNSVQASYPNQFFLQSIFAQYIAI